MPKQNSSDFHTRKRKKHYSETIQINKKKRFIGLGSLQDYHEKDKLFPGLDF